MDGSKGSDNYLGALERIAAMLLALAALAERVSGLSRPVRCLVLWILRPAEAAAHEFVTEHAHLQAADGFSAPFARSGDSPADAIRLALRFRAMARALCHEARKALRLARKRVRTTLIDGDPDAQCDAATKGDASQNRAAAMFRCRVFALNGPPPDTS